MLQKGLLYSYAASLGVKAVLPGRAWGQRLGWLLLLLFPASPFAHNDAHGGTAPSPGLGKD